MWLSCGALYEDMIDHSSYAHNFKSSCEVKAEKQIKKVISQLLN